MSATPAPPAIAEGTSQWRRLPAKPVALLATLVAITLTGSALLACYYLAYIFELFECMSFFGGSGPPEHLVGGPTESMPAAVATGGALWLASATRGWRLRSGRDFLVLVGLFALGYALALVLLGEIVSPAIWGPERCEPY